MTAQEDAPLSALRVGAVLSSPIYEAGGAQGKILGAGVVISEDLLTRLRTRGIETVRVSSADLATLQTCAPQGTAKTAPLDHDYVASLLESDESRELDLLAEDENFPDLEEEPPFEEQAEQREGSYDPDALNAVSVEHEQHVDTTDRTLAALNNDGADPLTAICDEALDAARQDQDLFACLGVNPFATSYPARHSVHMACVAIAIGARMGYGKNALRELALGCLIHDAGMLRVPAEIYGSKERLVASQVREIAGHPVHTLEMLGPYFERVPFASRMVAFQIHERCDGSGYPRGRRGPQIHPLAKVAAIADSYVALAAERPYREGMQPYYVMTRLLDAVKKGLFDANAMRGLLRAVSIFPLGSFVATSDGRAGRVIRPSGEAYDRPVIELWDGGQRGRPAIVDLTQEPDLKVVKPLVSLDAG